MRVKNKVKKASAEEEQSRLLRQILIELQTLNANLRTGRAVSQATIDSGTPLDDEELEEYE